jgi:hypothetical protein
MCKILAASCCALILWTLGSDLRAADESASGQASGALARRAFERLKGLEGRWQAKSTRGWSESAEYRVIAKGSAVLEYSFFADSPADEMATVFHLDGGRLMLTHYCEAGNQPRMLATRIAADAREVQFTLLDITNLSSPDAGHMDHVEFRFHDDGTFTSRWSFHRGGKEVWGERIAHRRLPGGDGLAPR